MKRILNTITGAENRWKKTLIRGTAPIGQRFVEAGRNPNVSLPTLEITEIILAHSMQFLHLTVGPMRVKESPFKRKWSSIEPSEALSLTLASWDGFSAMYLLSHRSYQEAMQRTFEILGFDEPVQMNTFKSTMIDQSTTEKEIISSLWTDMRSVVGDPEPGPGEYSKGMIRLITLTSIPLGLIQEDTAKFE